MTSPPSDDTTADHGQEDSGPRKSGRRWIPFIIVGGGLGAAVALLFRAGGNDPELPAPEPAASPVESGQRAGGTAAKDRKVQQTPILLVDTSHALRDEFVSFSGMTPEKHFPTANGTGVAMIDYDQDGWLDLYFANSCRLDTADHAPPNALFRRKPHGDFHLVSSATGTDVTGFTQGVAVADVDNDGFPDLYLTRYGKNILLQNNGDGSFTPIEACGIEDPRWGTSAAFFDFDEDGNLDVYVANYGKWNMSWHKNHPCGEKEVRMYCNPQELPAETDGFFQSLGDGRFKERTSELGIARDDGRGQGVVACDVNQDGHVDLFVANDLSPNFLFINTGDGRFQDHTETSGANLNDRGVSEACMGVDAGDVDEDGLPDLYVTNFRMEHNTLYQNVGRNLFQDVSNWSGVAAGSMPFVGWGTALEDLDNDGWLDIFVVNGHVDDNLSELGKDVPYRQPPALWRNVGKGRFEVQHEGAGDYFQTTHVSRGAAFGDLDNDGDLDIVVSHKDEQPTILTNESSTRNGPRNAWLQLKLVGTRSNRDAVGTHVAVQIGDRVLQRHIRGGKSYLSAHDLRLTIGLGAVASIDRVTITWPSGQTEVRENLAVDRSYTIRETSATAPSPPKP